MISLAGFLLLFMDEESAFWLLTALVEDIVPDYYAPSMIGTQVSPFGHTTRTTSAERPPRCSAFAHRSSLCSLVPGRPNRAKPAAAEKATAVARPLRGPERALPSDHDPVAACPVHQHPAHRGVASSSSSEEPPPFPPPVPIGDHLPKQKQTMLRVFDTLFCEGSGVLIFVGLAIFKLKERALLAAKCVPSVALLCFASLDILTMSLCAMRHQGFRRVLDAAEGPSPIHL